MTPWRSPLLQWHEDVQTITGVRRFSPTIFSQLEARYSVGETAEEAAAWIKELEHVAPHR